MLGLLWAPRKWVDYMDLARRASFSPCLFLLLVCHAMPAALRPAVAALLLLLTPRFVSPPARLEAGGWNATCHPRNC